MPYIVVLKTPPIQVYVRDGIFPIFEENAPETHVKIIKEFLNENRHLIGESQAGGLIVITLDNVAFLQYVTEDELATLQEEAKKSNVQRNIQVPRFMVPGAKPPFIKKES